MEWNRTDYGRRLIPNIIDENVRMHPQREAFMTQWSDSLENDWRAVTWKQYANAINRCAHEIDGACGKAPKGRFPTLAYIGPQDVRYIVFMVAAVKAGYVALFVSPRNSVDGQLNLLEQTNCHTIFLSESHRLTVEPWLKMRDMKSVRISPFRDLLSEEEVPPYPYNKTFEEGEWDPLCVLHTSGSTGLPKPIVVMQGMMAICDNYHVQPDWQGYTHYVPAWAQRSKRIYAPMPLFHAAALYTFIMFAIYFDTPLVIGIGDRPLTSDLVVESLNSIDVDVILLPPSILEELSVTEEGIAALKRLQIVAFGGGNLSLDAGDRLVKNGVNIQNTVNSTEFTPYPCYYQPRPELWQWLIYNDDLFGADWRQLDEDSYELVIVRKDKLPGLQGFFYTIMDAQEVSTKDIYKPHPSLPYHWIYHGRADNIIVFSNGEKLNPLTIEETVQGHPQVKGALVVGSNRMQAALLLEPSEPTNGVQEEREFINRVWPLVERANESAVNHGRISRDFIIVSNPNKPFPRSGKGGIQRATVLSLYADEIDRHYEIEEQVSHLEIPPLDTSSEGSLVKSIETILKSDLNVVNFSADMDLFSRGIDSRQVVNMSRWLRTGLNAAGHAADTSSLGPRAIYNNSTPRRLAQYIINNVVRREGVAGPEDEERHEIEVMEDLYKRYTPDLSNMSGRPHPSIENRTIILTGSTGTLGSYLLDQLVRDTNIKMVVCLNRAKDGGIEQQTKSMKDRALADSYSNKAKFYQVDLSQYNFGLHGNVYARLLKETDCVIHSAWPVNFNMPTEAFESHLCGVKNIASFAATTEKRIAVVFLSSVSTFGRWDPSTGPVLEERHEDWKLPRNGYGRSKMIGSLILEDSARASDFSAATIRLGQIAGPEAEAGVWSRQEWLPSLIASSLHLSALPMELPNHVDWIPVERVAKLVCDVANAAPREINGYFHGVNQSVTSWAKLAPAVKQFYGSRIKDLVSLKEWVSRLEKSQTDDPKVNDASPGLKIFDTYLAMVQDLNVEPAIIDTQRMNHISAAMRETTAVTPELMAHWCAQWKL